VTHNLGNPRPYRAVCRELYRHEARIRQERPLRAIGCQTCDGSGFDTFGMPGEPCLDCHRPLRQWVKVAGRVAWVLVLALLALASFCTFRGW